MAAALFFAVGFFEEPFLVALLFAAAFLAGLFRDAVFFFPAGFLLGDFFGVPFRFLATPVTAAPRAAALAAAKSGFSVTVDTTFLAPVPTADAASPAFSVTVSIADWLSGRFCVMGLPLSFNGRFLRDDL